MRSGISLGTAAAELEHAEGRRAAAEQRLRSASLRLADLVRMTPTEALGISDFKRLALPRPGLRREVNRWRLANLANLRRRAWKLAAAATLEIPTVYGALYCRVIRRNGDVVDYGLASVGVVTNAGVGFVVDAFQNLVELEIMKYHGIGTGTASEAAADTGLGAELSSAYNPDSTRATGSLTESSSNVFRTVGTNTVDASAAITEHGIFSQAATGGGTLLDRSVFSAINLASADSLQTTYDFTVTSGG